MNFNLDAALTALIGDDGFKVPGFGVIVFKDGAEIYSRFLGSRVLGKKNKPVTRDTRFRAASVSKMFTVFALLQLVERGQISLNDDAGDYLPCRLRNPACPHEKITVRMLASHTSSLRDGKIYSIPPTESVAELVTPRGKFWEDGAHFAPSTEPVGQYFTYSNLNYGLLGTIIENVTGQRFDRYQKENLFRQLDIKADYLPANLEPSEFELLGTIYQKKNALGQWNERGKWFGQIDDCADEQPPKDIVRLQNPYAPDFQDEYSLTGYRVGTNATIFSPQGGLRISFAELAHALEMMMNGGLYRGRRILSRESLDEIFRAHWIYDPQSPNGRPYGGAILNYGLGTYRVDGRSRARVCRSHEVDLLGHTGAAYGLLSGIFFRPNTRDGFLYMLNGEAIAEDFDPRSHGVFSDNYIWEEKIMDAVCNVLVDDFAAGVLAHRTYE